MDELTDRTRPVRSIHPLRIALLSPPMLPVPPLRYAGTERVVATLAEGLHQRGHDVTLFAPGDSDVSCELIATIPKSLWSTGYGDDPSLFINLTLARAWSMRDRFDLIHSHVETLGLLFARMCPTPVLSTMHGRLDAPGIASTLAEFTDVPLVAISANQRRWFPQANWVGTVHHGLSFAGTPFEPEPGRYLAFVGRVAPEKGVADAIALARSSGLLLRMAAKVNEPRERSHFEAVVAPAIDEGIVEFLGEVGSRERDDLFAGALATVMLGPWPEPFGLVAIESMATGTPVIARRAGALPEVVDEARTGFLVDDVEEARLALERAATLDRRRVRDLVLARFSAERMVDDYERIYRRLVADATGERVAGALRALPIAPEGEGDAPLAVGAASGEALRS